MDVSELRFAKDAYGVMGTKGGQNPFHYVPYIGPRLET